MTWNTQDTNMGSYVPKANVDHTINGQGTGISTLDHSATTPQWEGENVDKHVIFDILFYYSLTPFSFKKLSVKYIWMNHS